MDVNSLLIQGANAYKAGDNQAAYHIFRQAVKIEPNNPKALYYLAGVEPNLERKRKILHKVLQIAPHYEAASRMLSQLPPPIQADGEFSFDVPTAKPKNNMTLDAVVGADLKNEPSDFVSVFVDMFKSGIDILFNKPGAYPMAIRKASWQHFMIYIAIVHTVMAATYGIATLISTVRVASSPFYTGIAPNYVGLVFTFVIIAPIGAGALLAALYLSHQFVINVFQGRGSFLAHAFAAMLPVSTVNIITSPITMILSQIPILSAINSLVGLIVGIYALVIAAKGVAMVHKLNKGGGCWTIGIFVIIQIVTSVVILVLFSGMTINT